MNNKKCTINIDRKSIYKPNKELKEALEEGENILNRKIKTKTYNSVKELIKDLENEN